MGDYIKLNPDGFIFKYFRNNKKQVQSDIINYFQNEREKVTNYIKGKYKLDRDDAEDCFMQGSIALWRNITEGTLTEENLTSSLSSYLMRCCCNHATHILVKKKRTIPLDTLFKQPRIAEDGNNLQNDAPTKHTVDNEFKDYKDEQINILEKIIRNLPEPCNTILWNVYFNYHEIEQECQNKETIMDVIALMLGMKKTVLKTTKNRCMQKVKNKVNSML